MDREPTFQEEEFYWEGQSKGELIILERIKERINQIDFQIENDEIDESDAYEDICGFIDVLLTKSEGFRDRKNR